MAGLKLIVGLLITSLAATVVHGVCLRSFTTVYMY
jgi:hypothetical protein